VKRRNAKQKNQVFNILQRRYANRWHTVIKAWLRLMPKSREVRERSQKLPVHAQAYADRECEDVIPTALKYDRVPKGSGSHTSQRRGIRARTVRPLSPRSFRQETGISKVCR